jgi:16S rRNA (adenine1518-N6/adenine1519-N6)-dimethyltransferase
MSFIRAKKSLGQHFLNSPSVLAKIIAAAKLQPGGRSQTGETVLEIGPGTGVLTEALLEAGGSAGGGSRSDSGARVIAVEKDHIAFEFLKIKFDEAIRAGRLKLIEGDILDERIDANIPNDKFALVANIPYYITGAILEKFLEYGPRPDRMVLLVQKEVAERIVAKPASGQRASAGKESILSISVKAFGTPHLVATVPRGAFTPAPTVDSAILAIEDISDRNFSSPDKDSVSSDTDTTSDKIARFFEIVRAGFAHKRKFLIRNLETVATRSALERAWKDLGLSEKVRAEELSCAQWISVSRSL